MENLVTTIVTMIGTFTFALSGIKLAAGKDIDWFGAYVVGLATAIGGGTARDLLLGVTPFWMLDGRYFVMTGAALLTILLFKGKILRWPNTLFLFDTIGLGLFTVAGISKSIDADFPFWVCIVMGTITGSLGGLVRDVLLNEVPLLLRKDIYALACVAGGFAYFACVQLGIARGVTEIIAAVIIILARIIAIKFHIQLPTLKAIRHDDEEKREK